MAISEGSLSFLPLGADALIDAAVTSGCSRRPVRGRSGEGSECGEKKRGDQASHATTTRLISVRFLAPQTKFGPKQKFSD